MANRTGNSDKLPHIDARVGVSDAAPRVRYSTTSSAARNAGQAQFTLAETLRQVSSRVEDRLDLMAQADATRQGALAGAGDKLPTLQDESTIRGRAFNVAARDAAVTRLDLQGRRALSDYEKSHPADIVGFEEKASSYLEGVYPELRAFDPALAERYKADFELRSDSVKGRIEQRHTAIVKDQQLEVALRHQLAVQDELASQAQSLFSGQATDAQQTLTRMMTNASMLVNTANQIGPDGQPLFSARERVAMERDAEKLVSSQVGLAWMHAQPDMLTAFEKWQKGEATFELAGDDGQVTELNLKDVLGANGYQKAGEAFFDQLRAELALQNQVDAAQERAFKDGSDALYADMQVLAQDGRLTLKTVEDARGLLEEDRYIALREIAKGGFATVSNDGVLSDMINRDASGEDIRAALKANKASLTSADYTRLYERNVTRLDKGIINPVSTGRDYVGNSLGKLATELGFAQSLTIPKAEAEYEIRVQQFIEKNERQPNHTEALDIAGEVVDRYAVFDMDTQIATMPKPMMMTAAQKLSKRLGAADIDALGQKTTDHFLKLNGGDAAKLQEDERYIEEMDLLRKYHEILQVKESNNARPVSGQ